DGQVAAAAEAVHDNKHDDPRSDVRLTLAQRLRSTAAVSGTVKAVAALAGTSIATLAGGIGVPAAMAARGLAMPVHVSGTVVATWHGDPARGCATAGVCATSGSATS